MTKKDTTKAEEGIAKNELSRKQGMILDADMPRIEDIESWSEITKLEHMSNPKWKDKLWYTLQEAADMIGRSAEFVRKLVQEGQIQAHVAKPSKSAKNDTANGEKRCKRKSIRVSRTGILTYLLQTANYNPHGSMHSMMTLLDTCAESDLEEYYRFAKIRYSKIRRKNFQSWLEKKRQEREARILSWSQEG